MLKWLVTIGRSDMKKCENCGVNVNTSHNTCPLCNRELVDIGGKKPSDVFKPYEQVQENKTKQILYKLFMFLSIIAISVCVAINLLTQVLPLWSLIVIIGIVYCWVLIVHTILSRRSIFEKIFLQIGVILALLFVCEWISSSDKWMVDYVIPSISIVVILVFFILSQSLKYHKGLLAFFIMTCILTLLSGILLLCNVLTFTLLNDITVIVGVIGILGMLLFSGGVLKTEFSKKFHL